MTDRITPGETMPPIGVEDFQERYPPPGDPRRWQLLDGRPVPMALIPRRRRILTGRLVCAPNSRLTGSCRAEHGARIRLLRPNRPDGYYVADVATSCAPVGCGPDTPAPVVVAEWLPEIGEIDPREKLADYQDLPSVQGLPVPGAAPLARSGSPAPPQWPGRGGGGRVQGVRPAPPERPRTARRQAPASRCRP